MSAMDRSGIVSVARIDDLSPLEATLICCVRLFHESDETRDALERGLLAHLGDDRGGLLFHLLVQLCEMTRQHARRPLMLRHAGCCAAGADEAAFAAMVTAAASGEREDAMLIAVCLVRADLSPHLVALAEQVGLSLMPLAPALTADEVRTLH